MSSLSSLTSSSSSSSSSSNSDDTNGSTSTSTTSLLTTTLLNANLTDNTSTKIDTEIDSMNIQDLLNVKNDGGLALGFDIGGSLCKICFFEGDLASKGQKQMANVVKSSKKYGSTGHRIDELSFRSDMLKGTFHFISFSTHRYNL